jgi:hypothetical protein
MPFGSHEISLDTKAQVYAKALRSADDHDGRQRTIDYLKSHGLDGAIAGKYQLGFVDRPAPGDERFRGTLSIPYLTRAGVVALKYRCTVEDCDHRDHAGKYMQHSGQASRLFNPEAFFSAAEADAVIGMSEGEIDSIVATEIIGVPTLGMPGATQWGKNAEVWKCALDDYDSVLFFADGDAAGLECGRLVVSDLGKKGKLVKCDDEEDVASMVRKGRAMTLRERAGMDG